MPCGWHIHHRERFTYRANSGNPQIQLKVYHYPEYRQRIEGERLPAGFRVKKKGHNRFLVFNGKVASKGIISLERELQVFPEGRKVSLKEGWGSISDIDRGLAAKYRQASRFWPDTIEVEEEWFESDDLSEWVASAWRYIRRRIEPENQEKRWGAEEALKRGIGDCDEFTDIFMSLARRRGIPCRRITGFFMKGKPERHAWAEVLSPLHGWLTVDIALNNIGSHTADYIVLKVEEFNPAISDYSVRIGAGPKVHYEWDIEEPEIKEIPCEEHTFS